MTFQPNVSVILRIISAQDSKREIIRCIRSTERWKNFMTTTISIVIYPSCRLTSVPPAVSAESSSSPQSSNPLYQHNYSMSPSLVTTRIRKLKYIPWADEGKDGPVEPLASK
jgi:hypothetical protein